MSAPDAFAARVMESYLRLRRPTQLLWDDELLTAILLDIRVGTFKEGNLNMFKRYCFDVFRCHVCNHVLPIGSHAPDTTAHMTLHRHQVMAVLNATFSPDPSWEHTDEPTEEEVRQEDLRCQTLAQGTGQSFQEARR